MSRIASEELQFIDRFKASLLLRAGRDTFSDGCTIADYASETGPTYWQDARFRALGPEKCAEADMRYWFDI